MSDTDKGKARPLPAVKKKITKPVPIKNLNAAMLNKRPQQPGADRKQLPSMRGGGTESLRVRPIAGPTAGRDVPGPTTIKRTPNKVLPGIKSPVERFEAMLRGDVQDMPPKPSSEVRIFLSSTFSDLRWERNELVRVAFPRLREFCASHQQPGGGGAGEGLELRVVDMRWGVTDDATSDHATQQLCEREIADCQRRSLGTCFICILGDRYGYQPLQASVPAWEYELIYAEAKRQDHPKVSLLDQWYKKDENAVPPHYILQPIRSILPEFGSYGSDGEETRQSKAARQAWWEMSDCMLTIIRAAVDALGERGALSGERCHEYHRSVTEAEVAAGLREAGRCLCFVRRFKGLDNATVATSKLAPRFIDVANRHGQKVIDEKVGKLRKDLQEKRVAGALNASQVGFWEVEWHQEGLDPDLYPDHRSYMAKLTTGVSSAVMQQVSEAASHQERAIPATEYYTVPAELHHHLHFAGRKIALFRGQEDVLEDIRAKLLEPCRVPILVHGESGAGKTSLMAKVFASLPEWLGQNTVRVVRFLGTSPLSSDIYSALRSVAGQLADCFGMIMEPAGHKTHRGLVKYLPRFLRIVGRAAGKDHVVVLLDSVDQLLPKFAAYEMRWLPTDLPGNVHVIVSTVPSHGNILHYALKHLANKATPCIEVRPLPETTGKEILDGHLASKHRTLTPEQRQLVEKLIAQVPSPLYVKLLADRALSWRSYTNVDHVKLGSSVRLAISQLFYDLEGKYGVTLIQNALGYLTVGIDGLTETELEDVLSCDDAVLNEVYQFHNPPVPGVVTIPPLLWARVRNDISEYLTERQSYGKTTLFWYHRQFIEVATERFVNGKAPALHKHLADYFAMETSVKRDITLLKRNLIIHSADRQITPQALVPKSHRKLQALPYHLKNADDPHQLKSVALCSLNFMKTKISGMGLSALISDYDSTDPELVTLGKCLSDLKPVWRSLSLLPVDLLARLDDDCERAPHISQLLAECRAAMVAGPVSLMPVFPCLAQSPLLRSLHHEAHVVHAVGAGGARLVVGVAPRYRLVDVQRGTEAALTFVPCLIPPTLANDGTALYFVQKQLKQPPPRSKHSNSGDRVGRGGKGGVTRKEKQEEPASSEVGVDLLVLRVSVTELLKGESVAVEECLTVQIAPEDLPPQHDIRVNAIALDSGSRFLAMCFSDRYLIVKDLAPKATAPGLISELKLHGQQGLVSTAKTSLVMFTGDGSKVIALIGNADDSGTLWTSVNIQDTRDKRDRAFHIPGLAWFQEVSLLMNDTLLFLAVKAGNTTRVGLVDISDAQDGGLSVDYLKLDMHIAGITTAGLERPRVYIASHQHIYVHDLLTRQPIHTLTIHTPTPHTQPPHITCIAVEDDEEHVYAGDRRGQLHVWRTARYLGAIHTNAGEQQQQQQQEQQQQQQQQQQEEQEDEVRHVAVSRSDGGSGVAVVTVSRLSGTLRCWRQDVLCERATKLQANAAPLADRTMTTVATAAGEKLSDVRSVTCLLFQPNKQHILVTDHKHAIKLWSVASGKCLRSNPKPRGLEHAADEMLWDVSSQLLFLLNCSSEFRLCICDMDTGQYVHLPQLDGLDVLAMTLSSPDNKLYIVTKHHGQCTLWIFDAASRSIEKSIVVPSKNTFQTNCMKVRLTDTSKYLVFMIKCTEIEVNIIRDAEKKGNLSISPSFHTCPSYKFAALNLKQPTKELLLCYRQLTKIITLGSVMELLDGNVVLIGRQRVSLQWDIDSGGTDSKLVKGTKTPQYFRPIWIEHEQDWGSICHGPIHAIHRNAPPAKRTPHDGEEEGKHVASVLAQGSEDGWCMIYDETGQSVNINMGKHSNHDGSPVVRVCVSGDSEWVLSASADHVLKCWSAVDGREVFAVRLNMAVSSLVFDEASEHVAVLGQCSDGTTKVAMFKLVGGN